MNPAPGTVVVVHAHPDDEAIFTAATIHLLAGSGVRVVLVTATDGAAGIPRIPLRRGETLARRRAVELERSCELLGVQRLVWLGYRDSGAHAGPYHPRSLGAHGAEGAARRIEQVVEAEGATALIHYDRRGIYGHVDHVLVHRAGAAVVERLGITGYEATVDAERLRAGGGHVLAQAAGEGLDAGLPASAITTTVRADERALVAKWGAMAAHASQVLPAYLDAERFAASYRDEWFRRRGAPGVLEELVAAPDTAAWPPVPRARHAVVGAR